VSGVCQDTPASCVKKGKISPDNTWEYMIGEITTFMGTMGAPVDRPIEVFFYSTAGMRYVENGDTARTGLLNVINVGKFTDAAGYYTANCNQVKPALHNDDAWACRGRTILGKEEAKYAWIAAQALNPQNGQGPTVGLVEMGGASVQIAFEAEGGSSVDGDADNQAVETVDGTDNVFIKSVNGLGGDQIVATLLTTDVAKAKCNFVAAADTKSFSNCKDAIRPALTQLYTGIPTPAENPLQSVAIGGGVTKLAWGAGCSTLVQLFSKAESTFCDSLVIDDAWPEYKKRGCVTAAMFGVLTDLGHLKTSSIILEDNQYPGHADRNLPAQLEVGMPYGVAIEASH
jgi:hypothetical protein